MKKLIFLLLLASLLAPYLLVAGIYGTLKGKVCDESNIPCQGATISINGTELGAYADVNGNYTIIGIPPGEYKVVVSMLGYGDYVNSKVEIKAERTTFLNAKLSIEPQLLDCIVVTTERLIDNQQIGSGSVNKSAQFSKLIHDDISSLVNTTAGVQAGSGFNIRCSRDTETQIRVDGLGVGRQFTGGYGALGGYYPMASSYTYEQTEQLTGGYSAEYGEAMGGIVSAIMKTGGIERLDGMPGSNQDIEANNSSQKGGLRVVNDKLFENDFLETRKLPVSTFSIDVDAASYSIARSYINYGQAPPRDNVRIEEFINYFSYDYPQPADGKPFSITMEYGDCPWNKSHKLVHIGLQGINIPADSLPPNNLVFLIDVSGSMSSPEKLPLVQSSLKMLVSRLRKEDKISIVVYAGAAGLVLPPTSGKNKSDIISAIDKLSAGGSTAGGAGIELAYKTAKENFIENGNNRVILATDGDFNVGISSEAELTKLIEEKRKDGIFLTVLGFGLGNYQDSKMETLADKGNGNYAYIDNIKEAHKALVLEMSGTLKTIAKDVKIQIDFNPAKIKEYRLIGYENRLLNEEDFDDDLKDAGELGAGHTVTALYEIVPMENSFDEISSTKYRKMTENEFAFINNELMSVKLRYKDSEDSVSKLIENYLYENTEYTSAPSINFLFSAAVAEFCLVLKDSKYKGTSTFDEALALAKESKGQDAEGFRAEFIQLIEQCKKNNINLDKLSKQP